MPGKTTEIAEFLGLVVTAKDLGSAGAGTTTPVLEDGGYQRLTCTAATRTIAAPTYRGAAAAATTIPDGTRLVLEVKNSSGGVLTITWDAAFLQAATAPANTKTRVFEFVWNGTSAKWVQFGAGVDV